MKSFRSASLLLGLLCLTAASVTAQADDRKFELQCHSDDRFLQVYADHPVESARCRSIVGRVLKAYAFITKQADWKNPGILWAKPLQFRLLGGALNVLGYAQGPNLMVMRDDYLDKPLSEGTLAHELTHIQDLRQLQGKKLPSYLLEGRALTIGNAYRMSVGQEPGDYDRQMAGSAIRFTASQAIELLDDYQGRGWNNQAIGTLVVEYMRTAWKGSGVPNIHPRLSRMIERVATGEELETAFQNEFGETAAAFVDAFANYLRATQNDPSKRLQNTMWHSIRPAQSASSSQAAYIGDVVDFVGELLE